MRMGFASRPGVINDLLVFCALWAATGAEGTPRERSPFGAGWRFQPDDPPGVSGCLAYETIRAHVLPTGEQLLGTPGPRPLRSEGNQGGDVTCVQPGFDDTSWR